MALLVETSLFLTYFMLKARFADFQSLVNNVRRAEDMKTISTPASIAALLRQSACGA